ncbi:MAG: DMT family transporter [Sulfitobacter sp.]
MCTRNAASGKSALWLSVVVLGLNWPVMKLGLDYVSPFWMLALRYGLCVPAVGLFVLVTRRRLPTLIKADVPVILGVAALQFVMQMGLVTWGLQHIPAGTASILIYTTPLWLFFIDWIALRQRPDLRRTALVSFSAIGCGVVVAGSTGEVAIIPLATILLASVFWSLSMRLIGNHRWAGGVRDALFWQFLLASIVVFPIAWWAEGPLSGAVFSWPSIGYLLFIGPVASGLGFGLMVFAGHRLPAPRIAMLSTAAPVIGFITATVILAEPLIPSVIFGGVIIIGALLLGARK